jgi:hypothetical protein
VYGKYCANQVIAKSVLDLKKRDTQINDFLERCQDSPFSRHLDLWNFLGNVFHCKMTVCCLVTELCFELFTKNRLFACV